MEQIYSGKMLLISSCSQAVVTNVRKYAFGISALPQDRWPAEA